MGIDKGFCELRDRSNSPSNFFQSKEAMLYILKSNKLFANIVTDAY